MFGCILGAWQWLFNKENRKRYLSSWNLHSSRKRQKNMIIMSVVIHSSIAWRIPWTEEPDGLQSIGSQRLKGLSTRGRCKVCLFDPLFCFFPSIFFIFWCTFLWFNQTYPIFSPPVTRSKYILFCCGTLPSTLILCRCWH